MYYAKEIDGHKWCIFDYKTCIMLYEGMTWEEVLEFARKNNLPNREYDRENNEVILY